MGEGFEVDGFRLKEAHLENVGGWLFVSLADEPPSIEPFRQDVLPFLQPVEIDSCKVAFESNIVEEGNWKLVMENNRECYHCAGSHPELCRTLSEYDAVDDPRADAAYLDLLERQGRTGRSSACPISDALEPRLPGRAHALRRRCPRDDDGRRVRPAAGCSAGSPIPTSAPSRMLSLPNTWNHLGADHVVAFRVLPLGPERTLVTTKWLVHKEAVEGVDYDVGRLTRGVAGHQRPGPEARRDDPGGRAIERLRAWALLACDRGGHEELRRLVHRRDDGVSQP